jgi:hypothetical protein
MKPTRTPHDAAARSQLGPRALALVGTLSGQFHLTQGKIQRLLEQVMGLKFSMGT